MKLGKNKLGRVVYPRCLIQIQHREAAGLNHPSQLVLFKGLSGIWDPSLIVVSCEVTES
jgi:hypothetical protein